MSTKIEWCTETWNPIAGCTKVSPGCDHCYAERMANRLANIALKDDHHGEYFRVDGIGKYAMVTLDDKWNGKTFFDESQIVKPFRWKVPRKIFVISMGDLFHESVVFADIDQVITVIAMNPQHTFLVLTKRPDRMKRYFENRLDPWDYLKIHAYNLSEYLINGKMPEGWMWDPQYLDDGEGGYDKDSELIWEGAWPLKNLWLGVTAENQEYANKRIPILLQIPAIKRFVSVEPMLGPIDFYEPQMGNEHYNTLKGFGDISGGNGHFGGPKLDWVICGGESGPGARPLHPDWVRSIRDQCKEANVPFFFKQWGMYRPFEPTAQPPFYRDVASNVEYDGHGMNFYDQYSGEPGKWKGGQWIEDLETQDCIWLKVGKKVAGSKLEGKEYKEYPK
jgi:protein gp37